MGTMNSKQTATEMHQKKGGNRLRKFRITKRLSLKSAKQEYNFETTHSYIVRYVGKMEMKTPGGEGMEKCLREMYHEAQKRQNQLARVCLTITARDLAIRQIGAAEGNETLIPISRISFVVADKKHQVFAFNDFVSKKPRKIDCHVFICSDSESSRTITSVLQDALKTIYDGSARRISRREQENENF